MSLWQHSDITRAFRFVKPSQTKARSILTTSVLTSFIYYKSLCFLHCTCLYTWQYAWQSVAVSFVSL